MEEKDRIVNIPVEDILPNRFQPRLAFDEKELNELSNSIIKYGIIQPIVLRKMGEKYEIIAGERRYKASVLAGLKTIPAIINNTDDNTSAEIALLENLQRKNLSVIEEAQSFKKLLDKGFTQDEIATKLGISQSSIANKIRLLNLPRKVQDALLYNKISERHARSLLSLNNSELQLDLLDKIINNRLTVKQTEDEISKILNKTEEIDDIPEEIKKYLEPPTEQKVEQNKFIQDIPEVVNINMSSNQNEVESPKEEINPFQAKFEDNLKKIEEKIENNEKDFYDKIIENDLKNNFNFIEMDQLDKTEEESNNKSDNNDGELETIELNTQTNDKETLPKVISSIRTYVKSLNKNGNVTTREIDLPDKYQIIVEIRKD